MLIKYLIGGKSGAYHSDLWMSMILLAFVNALNTLGYTHPIVQYGKLGIR